MELSLTVGSVDRNLHDGKSANSTMAASGRWATGLSARTPVDQVHSTGKYAAQVKEYETIAYTMKVSQSQEDHVRRPLAALGTLALGVPAVAIVAAASNAGRCIVKAILASPVQQVRPLPPVAPVCHGCVLPLFPVVLCRHGWITAEATKPRKAILTKLEDVSPKAANRFPMT